MPANVSHEYSKIWMRRDKNKSYSTPTVGSILNLRKYKATTQITHVFRTKAQTSTWFWEIRYMTVQRKRTHGLDFIYYIWYYVVIGAFSIVTCFCKPQPTFFFRNSPRRQARLTHGLAWTDSADKASEVKDDVTVVPATGKYWEGKMVPMTCLLYTSPSPRD